MPQPQFPEYRLLQTSAGCIIRISRMEPVVWENLLSTDKIAVFLLLEILYFD